MSGPPFAVKGIDHIVLRVRALPRSLVFYRDVLGCRVEREQPELGLTQLRAGRSLIDLVTLDGPLGQASAARRRTERRPFLSGARAVQRSGPVRVAGGLRCRGHRTGLALWRRGRGTLVLH